MIQDKSSKKYSGFKPLDLYIFFSLYLLLTILFPNGNIASYISSCFLCFLLLFNLAIVPRLKINHLTLSLFLIVFILGSIRFFETGYYYILIYAILIIFLFVGINNSKLTLQNVLNIVSAYYIVYLTLSIIQWLGLVTFVADSNSFHYTIFSLNFITLYGLEGSTAFIDSFSGLIFLTHLFLGRSKYKWFFIVISLMAVIATVRVTPIMAILVSIIANYWIKNSFLAKCYWFLYLFLIIILVMFFRFYSHGELYSEQYDNLYRWLYYATHGRSIIWYGQINIILDSFFSKGLIIGWFDAEYLLIELTTLDGRSTGSYSYNPHNSILSLFFRSPIIFILLFFVSLRLSLTNFNSAHFAIVVYIFTISLSNATILSLNGVVYVLVLISIFILGKNNGGKFYFKNGNVKN